jgi:hypothetical protein
LVPLDKGNGWTQPRQNKLSQGAKTTKGTQGHKPQTHTRAPPCTYACSPWAKAHSPWTIAATQHGNANKVQNTAHVPRAVKPHA